MSATEPASIPENSALERRLDLDLSPDELWELVGDGDRWPDWLVHESEVEVAPGSGGQVVDDEGIERTVELDEVVPGEAVRFRWWPSDSPAEESSVELVVAPWGDGSRLTVRESRPGLAAAWFSASALVAPVPGPSALVTSVSITSTVGITVTGSCLRAAGVQFTLAA
ncbi:MAG: SRPBCC family protein [Ilumatobacteraceae bacterium]